MSPHKVIIHLGDCRSIQEIVKENIKTFLVDLCWPRKFGRSLKSFNFPDLPSSHCSMGLFMFSYPLVDIVNLLFFQLSLPFSLLLFLSDKNSLKYFCCLNLPVWSWQETITMLSFARGFNIKQIKADITLLL